MRLTRAALALWTALSLSACTFSFDWFWNLRAQNAIASHDFKSGLSYLQKIIDHDPDDPKALEAARQGATIAQLDAKNYPLAVDFYKHIVLSSPDAEERKSAQKFIAQIDFENLQNYDQAVVEYEKLLRLENTPEETFGFRLNLAKSQMHLNNIDQSLNEIDMLLAKNHAPDEIFEAQVLKAQTLVAAKKIPEAAALWELIITTFPEKSKKENVALNLVVCYEDMKEFGKAIEVLEHMREGYPHPEFLNLRIQRLKERRENMPGAKGLKK